MGVSQYRSATCRSNTIRTIVQILVGQSIERQEHHQHYSFLSVHPDRRPKNVILFGETGVGKSSVINLMTGNEVAGVSSGLEGCTLDAKAYPFTFDGGTEIQIFDTVGLEEPEMNINTFSDAVKNAHRLITSLHDTGGVDLLLFCIRAGTITTAMQRTYRMFFEILCGSQVPLAIVVTNLEREAIMEDWWIRNEATLKRYGIHSAAHACITAVPADVQVHAERREKSREVLQAMLLNALRNSKPYLVLEKSNWLIEAFRLLRSFLAKPVKKKDLLKKLKTDCTLPHNDAQKLVEILIKDVVA